jgi:FkbM family methyltransferase
VIRRVLAAINRLPIGERAVRCGGDRLYADTLDRYVAAIAWSRGWLAAGERAFIERTLRAGMVVVDVGANVGFHTLLMARCVGATGRVHAVEPEPRNFKLLTRAIEEAGYRQVRLHRAAAARTAGRVPLYVAGDNRGDHRLTPAAEARAQVTVSTVPLDDLLADEARIDFIKIDVQGAEVEVLAGLARVLASRPPPRLLCELSPDLLARAGASADAFFGPLRRAGLTPHRLERDGTPRPLSEGEAWRRAASRGYETVCFTPTRS